MPMAALAGPFNTFLISTAAATAPPSSTFSFSPLFSSSDNKNSNVLLNSLLSSSSSSSSSLSYFPHQRRRRLYCHLLCPHPSHSLLRHRHHYLIQQPRPLLRTFNNSLLVIKRNSGGRCSRGSRAVYCDAEASDNFVGSLEITEQDVVSTSQAEDSHLSRQTCSPASSPSSRSSVELLPGKAAAAPPIETRIQVCESVNCSRGDRFAGVSDNHIGLAEIYEKCRYWMWRDYKINYVIAGSGPAIVLVHGFGASLGHWRRNIGVLSLHNTVYALDLLGFGDSSKPLNFQYTMEVWGQLLLDFVRTVVGAPTILVGNSIGSLACLIAATEDLDTMIRGTILLNCAGGMNNKAVSNDWRLIVATPILWIIDLLLKQRIVASYLLNQLKTKENLKAILQNVYANKDAVDDELIEILKRPAEDHGALEAFVSIVTGPPGPSPMSLMNRIRNPVLILWGDKDPFTPINGPVGKYFCSLPSSASNVSLHLLPNAGHCPHDEQPESVNEKILAWISNLSSPH